MLFSICIPVYNVEKYLAECVESVLSQNVSDIEIILCDDGSTDSSGKICDEYAEKYPNIIRVIHKENEGLLLTRRVAIKASKGDWIIHLDSDDYMLPDYLSTVKNVIQSDPDLDMVMFKVTYGQRDLTDFSHESRLPFTDRQIFENETKELLYNQLIKGGYITAIIQKAAKREIVDVDTDYHRWHGVSMAEDYLQTLPLFDNSKKSVFIDKSFYYYRYNDKSITKDIRMGSVISAIYSLITVHREGNKYAKKWNIKNIDFVYSKQLKSIARKIFILLNNFSYKQLYSFLYELSDNQYIKETFHNCDRKSLGRLTFILYYLLLKKKFRLLFWIFGRRIS